MAHNHDHEHGRGGAHVHAHVHNRGGRFQLSRRNRLRVVIAISCSFFLAEIAIGFYTKSLALVADAFHYLNDLIGFIIALIAVHKTESKISPDYLSFGWVRAASLGAFFNGAFLIALALSIFLQSIERFVHVQPVENPLLVMIIGGVGFTLNVISVLFLHEHEHDHGGVILGDELTGTTHASHMHVSVRPTKHGMDLGMLGVIVHLVGDAINNIGVIISAAIIWKVKSEDRFYADPAVSTWIALMILITAIPLTRDSAGILLQTAPLGVKVEDVKHDLESIPGVVSVHELHVWRLDQRKAVASAHVVVSDPNVKAFTDMAKVFAECLHAYGIHSATLQPELVGGGRLENREDKDGGLSVTTTRRGSVDKCGVPCGVQCEELKCCT